MTPQPPPALGAPRDLADRFIRRSLRHPGNLADFLRYAVPDLASGFVFEQARLIDREFPLDDWRRREADLPFEIPFRGAEGERLALVCVLIEHQSDTDPLMPLRLLFFAASYWDRQWRQWQEQRPPRPSFRLAPVLPIVLYTGSTPWGSNRRLRDLLGEPAAFHAFAPAWEPLFWNLADQTPEQLLASSADWLQALAVMRAQGEDAATFLGVFTEAVRHLEQLHGNEHVRWYDLLSFLLTWIASRRPLPERPRILATAADIQSDAIRRKEVLDMTQTIAEAWIEEGRQKGRSEGLDQGRTEGRLEGRLEGRTEGRAEGQLLASRALLRRLLEAQFGTLPEALIQRIEAVADIEKLQAAAVRVPKLTRVEDLSL